MKDKILLTPKTISDISLGNPNDGLFITFDLDWCHEEVLLDSINLLEKYNAKATFFVTNFLDCLDNLSSSENYELGIHPNFNPFIHDVKKPESSPQKIIDDLLTIVPDARTIRCHSLLQSSRLTQLFFQKGITHESNIKIPNLAAPDARPFKHPTGMIMCPYHWGDYSDVSVPFGSMGALPIYFVVDFHPIHVFLNTENLDRYEKTRDIHQDPSELLKYRYEGYGTRSRLLELLELTRKI
jgi:hypothetical protein